METKEQKSKGRVVGSLIASVVLAITCGLGGWILRDLWQGRLEEEKKNKGGAENPMAKLLAQTQTVSTVQVKSLPYNCPERYIAHAEAVQEVDLLPQVDGYVKEIRFREGDVVKEGQLLYVLDDEKYQAIVSQGRANLSACETEERNAKKYYNRTQRADDRGITEKERDDALATWEKAKAKVEQARADLVVAEYNCKKAKVYAPIAGQIGKSAAHLGDYVSPNKGALAKIVQVDPIRVSFPMTDRAYVAWRQAKVRGGETSKMRMRLLLPDGSEYAHTGSFDFDDNQMSRETASIMMRLSFPNPDRFLVPNSFVTLLTDFEEPPCYPTVQQSAIVDLPGGNVGVYVVDAFGKALVRPVKILPSHDGLVPVVEGLSEGERVVISGTRKLNPKLPFKVAEVVPTANEENDPNYKPFKLDK